MTTQTNITPAGLLDKIIVSSDDNPGFLNFWPIVSRAWVKMLNLRPTLAFVTDRQPDDVLVDKLKHHGEVVLVQPVRDVPVANLAKLARFWVAATQNNPGTVSMIEDIDTVPLQPQFVIEKLAQRTNDSILAVGHDVYNGTEHQGKFPVSNITASTEMFARLFNPWRHGSFNSWVMSLKGLKVFDHKEDPWNEPENFSDESLIRALVQLNGCSSHIQKINRGVDIKTQWIDRSWWPATVDTAKLARFEYVLCNFPRPCKENLHRMLPVLQFLYDGNVPRGSELIVL